MTVLKKIAAIAAIIMLLLVIVPLVTTIVIIGVTAGGSLIAIAGIGLFALVRDNLTVILWLIGIAVFWALAGVAIEHIAKQQEREDSKWW